MARLTKKDWLEEGFKILGEFAQNKLKILYLCERLGVTRGSFYHHFSSIDNYIAELMQAWEEENTLGFIKEASKGDSPEEKMERLNLQVVQIKQALETSIRSWSFYHPVVREHLERVDKIRLSFLQGIFEEMGNDKKKSLNLAKLEYAILIGLQQLFPDISRKEMEKIYEVYFEG
ncbi:MAG TPA: TetR/AcrR family transcriptional regulator [Bacteroidetes bacterium]|nr:TetR/AcrR family transcriptional regulator [Bacteroidota bacterium]